MKKSAAFLAPSLILTVAVMLFETLPVLYAQQKIENAPLRVWTGPVFGGATIRAVLVEIGDKNVTLLTTDGRQLVVAVARLSEADQAHLRKTYNASIPISTDIGDHAGLLEAIRKYYQTVDRAKQVYASELRKALVSFQKAGNLAAYNAVDTELEHTVGKTGHQLTELKFPARSALERQKSSLKQAVDTARVEFKKMAKTIASDLLKNNQVGQARDVEALANAEEPPRFYIEKTKIEIKQPEPIPQKTIDIVSIPTVDMDEVFRHGIPMAILKRRFTGHTKGVISLDWSPDGTKIVSAGYEGKPILWDANSGQKLADLTLKGEIHGVNFDPSGKGIIIASHNDTVLWDIVSNKEKWKVTDGDYNVFAKASPDGKLCCIGDISRNKGFILRQMENGHIVHRFDNNGVYTINGGFDSKGNRVVVNWGNDAKVFDVKTGKLLLDLKNGHTESLRTCTFTTDDKTIITGGMDDTVVFWDARTGKPFKRLAHFHHDVTGLVFSHDGTKLAVARNEIGTVVFSTKTWEPICFTPWHGWWCNQQPAWSPDDRELATGHGNGDVLIWEITGDKEFVHYQKVRALFAEMSSAKLKREFSARKGSFAGFGRFTPDGKKFVAISRNESGANVFDVETGQSVLLFKYPSHLAGIDVSPDGKTVATGAANGKFVLWDIENGNILREIQAHEQGHWIDGVRFSHDGSMIATGSYDKTAAIFDASTGKEIKRLTAHSERVNLVDFTADDKILATAGADGKVILWDVATGEQLHCLDGHTNNDIRAMAFSPKGDILATGSVWDEFVVFWDVRTGKQLRRITGAVSGVHSLGFSPDGKTLAVAGRETSNSSVWDVETCLPLYRLPYRTGGTLTTTFSPDGKSVALCCHAPIPLWNVPSAEELKQWKHDLVQDRLHAGEILLIRMPLESGSTFQGYGPFSSARREFPDSIWAHTLSSYKYRLDKKWKTLKTSYGIRQGAYLGQASVIFIIKGDGKELFRSELIRDSLDREIELDVRGVEQLELITDPDGNGFNDHGVWFTPKLYR